MTLELFIGFWNVNLSPPVGKLWGKSKDEKKEKVGKIINSLLETNLDFLCLCEISPKDIEYIDQMISIIGKGYDYEIKHENFNGLYFDTCVIYKNSFNFLSMNYEVDGENRNKIKVFQKYEFFSSELKERIILYVTHWPSQLNDNSERRRTIASYMRKDILEEKKILKNTKFIVLGDFNVEPYDSSILHGLRSTRDKKVISHNSSLFYNPYWKFLPIQDYLPSGTHYYDKAEYHHWHIYDQILISGNFFNDGWDLDDKNVRIIDELALKSLHREIFNNPSDHLPILTKLEKLSGI